jgi:hypothetical protein
VQFTPGWGNRTTQLAMSIQRIEELIQAQLSMSIQRIEELIQGQFDGLVPVEDGCRELAR